MITLLGQGLEWYDFFLYLYLSVIFAKLYFPTLSTNNALILVSVGFTMTFFARIIGAYVYGRYGDTKGRAKAMVNSMICLGISAFCLALLPTYHTIGWLAPAALFVLRIFQGFSIAGEFAGSIVYVNEMCSTENRTRYFCYYRVFNSLGQLLAVGLFTLLHHALSSYSFYLWGWRVLYIIAAIFSLILYYYRKQLFETQTFAKIKQNSEPSPNIFSLLKTYRRAFTLCILIYAFSNLVYVLPGRFPHTCIISFTLI